GGRGPQSRRLQHGRLRPLQGGDLGRPPRQSEGSNRPVVLGLRRVHGHRLRLEQGPRRHYQRGVGPPWRWVQEQSRARRRPDPISPSLERRYHGVRRQRRIAGRCEQGGGLLPSAEGGGELRARDRDGRHRQGWADPSPAPMGLQLPDPRQGRFDVEGLRATERDALWLVRPGHQQDGAPPGRRPALARVHLFGCRTEHLSQGRVPACPPDGNENGWDDRSGCPGGSARRDWHATLPVSGTAGRRGYVRLCPLVGGDRLTPAGSPAVHAAARPWRGGRRLPLSWLGAVPFFASVSLLLLLPTVLIAPASVPAQDGCLTTTKCTVTNPPPPP